MRSSARASQQEEGAPQQGQPWAASSLQRRLCEPCLQRRLRGRHVSLGLDIPARPPHALGARAPAHSPALSAVLPRGVRAAEPHDAAVRTAGRGQRPALVGADCHGPAARAPRAAHALQHRVRRPLPAQRAGREGHTHASTLHMRDSDGGGIGSGVCFSLFIVSACFWRGRLCFGRGRDRGFVLYFCLFLRVLGWWVCVCLYTRVHTHKLLGYLM